MHARRSLLCHNNEHWVKKGNTGDFDVTMGCFDGAETCELVGLFLLEQIRTIVDQNHIGLYRDDGLGVLYNLSGPETDRIRKQLFHLGLVEDLIAQQYLIMY